MLSKQRDLKTSLNDLQNNPMLKIIKT